MLFLEDYRENKRDNYISFVDEITRERICVKVDEKAFHRMQELRVMINSIDRLNYFGVSYNSISTRILEDEYVREFDNALKQWGVKYARVTIVTILEQERDDSTFAYRFKFDTSNSWRDNDILVDDCNTEEERDNFDALIKAHNKIIK